MILYSQVMFVGNCVAWQDGVCTESVTTMLAHLLKDKHGGRHVKKQLQMKTYCQTGLTA